MVLHRHQALHLFSAEASLQALDQACETLVLGGGRGEQLGVRRGAARDVVGVQAQG